MDWFLFVELSENVINVVLIVLVLVGDNKKEYSVFLGSCGGGLIILNLEVYFLLYVIIKMNENLMIMKYIDCFVYLRIIYSKMYLEYYLMYNLFYFIHFLIFFNIMI